MSAEAEKKREPLATEQTCSTCEFKGRELRDGNLQCRRYPPTVNVGTRGGTLQVWPEMSPHAWCGEWKAA